MNAHTARTRPKPAYPHKAKIVALVAIARECGLDVAGIEVSPDGAIRVVEARAIPESGNEFDKWKDRM